MWKISRAASLHPLSTVVMVLGHKHWLIVTEYRTHVIASEMAYSYGKYRNELSFGRACLYLPVVCTLVWSRVACTRLIGAPRSRAWLACAWRSQWGEIPAGRLARCAAAFTMRKICAGRSGLPACMRASWCGLRARGIRLAAAASRECIVSEGLVLRIG